MDLARAYLGLARMRFLTMLAYRVNFYSGVLVYTVNIGAYFFLWQAVYAGRETLGGLTASQMTSYLAVAWMARAFWFNNLDREIAAEIRDGTVAVQMIRPYSYLLGKLVGALGEGLFRLIFYAAPGLFVAWLVFPVQLPGQARLWAVFGAAVFLSFFINSLVNAMVGMLSFFFMNNQGFMHAKRILVDVLSGLFLPLSFYPDWAQALFRLLPFQAIGYLPSLAFSGALAGRQLAELLATQVLWIAILSAATWVLWKRASRWLVVQGG